MLMKSGLFLFLLTVIQVSAQYKSVVQYSGFLENVNEGESAEVSSTSSRIVSGWEAQPGQHPHHVSLRCVSPTGAVRGCGGSIVSREWVITAAHCTALRITLVVRAGVVSLTNPEYIFETTEWYNHPRYNDNNANVQPNDISLVKLQRPVVYTKLLRAIRIQSRADAYANYHGLRVTASGHGDTWTFGWGSEVLRWVYLQAISNVRCRSTYISDLVGNTVICAGPFNVTTQSTCHGDGGGPLVRVGPNGIPTLIGVSSFLRTGNNACHGGHPTGFTRTGPYLSWFQQVTGIDFENLRGDQEIDTTTTSTTTTTTTTTTTSTPSTTTTDSGVQEPDDSFPEEDNPTQPDDSEDQEPDDSSPDGDTPAQPDDSVSQEPDDSSPEGDTSAQPDDSEEQEPDDSSPDGDTPAQPDDSEEQKPDDSSPDGDTPAQPDDSEEQEPDDSSSEGDTTAQPDDSVSQEPDDSSPEEDSNTQPDDSGTPNPEDSEEKEEDKEEEGEESDSSESNEDDEIDQLLKRLEVYVKVKVRLNKYKIRKELEKEKHIKKH